jgi:uncharacterized oxidoreductase
MQLSNNTILITGGTAGLGLAFAERFLELGNKVIICGRRRDRLDALAAKHPELITFHCDVSKTYDRERLLGFIKETHPECNILMNNAGVQYVNDLKAPLHLNRIYEELDTNLIAPIHLSGLFTEHLQTVANPAIINISSGLSFVPIAIYPVYCASKAAVHSYTMSLRQQLKSIGIKVYEVIPPAVDTELGHQNRADKNQSHGGMSVLDFLNEAMEGLEKDEAEIAVAHAKNLRELREKAFGRLNGEAE